MAGQILCNKDIESLGLLGGQNLAHGEDMPHTFLLKRHHCFMETLDGRLGRSSIGMFSGDGFGEIAVGGMHLSAIKPALLGKTFKVTAHRGEFVPSSLAPVVLATVHPSSLLRAPDEETRHRETKRFIDDLRLVAKKLGI